MAIMSDTPDYHPKPWARIDTSEHHSLYEYATNDEPEQ